MNTHQISKRGFLAKLFALSLATPLLGWAQVQPFKIGLVLPMTGPFASTGRQIDAAVKLYVQENGSSVSNRAIQVVLRDDGGIPDQTKRLAQELLTGEKVDVLAGFGITPSALAVGPLATQGKVPAVIMAAATSGIVATSPYFVRTSYTLRQSAATMAQWASKNKIKTVVTMVSDYGPGIDAEKAFKEVAQTGGVQILTEIRVPMRNPDFAPFLQKVRDLKPDAVYVFVPSGPAASLVKQFTERGLDKAGIKLIGDGGVTDDDLLPEMDASTMGVITSFHYSAAHESATNRKFVQAFQKANPGMRPNFMAVGGYDGMHVIYQALEKTQGKGTGEALVNAMRGLNFESPRGPIRVDGNSRDIVQNVYIRKVDRKNGQLWNVEIEAIPAVAP